MDQGNTVCRSTGAAACEASWSVDLTAARIRWAVHDGQGCPLQDVVPVAAARASPPAGHLKPGEVVLRSHDGSLIRALTASNRALVRALQ
jgi:hypothetical protein